MRIGSKLFIGLCLSLAACTASTASEPSGAGPEGPAAEGSATNDEGASNGAGSNAAPPASGESDPGASANADADAGVGSGSDSAAADAGVDAAPKPMIPAPTKGYLHAYTNYGTCEFNVDGVYKSTGNVLDLSLYGDAYVVGCKHSSGKYTEDFAVIEAGKTTNLMFDFQIIPAPSDPNGIGTLVAVAVGGSCAFSVNGSSVGSGATVKVPLKAGTYSVACKPVSGATKSRTVTVTADSTAMAMFKL